jgi:hypothetical protein
MNNGDVLRAFHEPPLPPSNVDIERAILAGRRQTRQNRGAAVVAVLILVLIAGPFIFVPALRGDQAADARRTQFTITASAVDGGRASAAELGTAATILESRLSAAGFPGGTVSVVGDHLVAVVRGRHTVEDIAPRLAPAALTVRKVINAIPRTYDPPGTDLPPWRGAPPPDAASEPPTRTAVLAKLGDAVAAAEAITDQTDAMADSALEPFRRLTPAEVAVLPPTLQFLVPQIECRTLEARPVGSVALQSGPVVACDMYGSKYLLDQARVSDADMASAVARWNGPAHMWMVDLQLNAGGIPKWTALTEEAFHNTGGACIVSQPRDADAGGTVCQVAFVVDNTVLSAPANQAVIRESALITGGTETETKQLAADLKYGRMPVQLTVTAAVDLAG